MGQRANKCGERQVVRTEQEKPAGRRVRAQLPQGAEMKGGDLSFRPLLQAFVPAWRKREKGKPTGGHGLPGRGGERTPRAARSPALWLEGTRDPPAPPCPSPPEVLSAGRRLTRVIQAREGARRPCPAVLADGLFRCFDTCAQCLMHLSLIYRPIKGSAFFKPPAPLPSTPFSLPGGNGGLGYGAETLLSSLPAPAPRADPYHASLQKHSLDGASASPGSQLPGNSLRGDGPRWATGKQASSRRLLLSLLSPPRVCDGGDSRPRGERAGAEAVHRRRGMARS